MAEQSKILLWLSELRAPFFTASALPVIVGTAAAYSQTGQFNVIIFILAVFATVALHAGANIANDYFDHISRNDWLNDNKTPFSGGSRLIQQNLLTAGEVIVGAWIALFIGAGIGLLIVILTKSFFVLLLGVIGLFGGYFYTATPFKLGYRTAGEITIGLLFGILPVYGSFYIQTLSFNALPTPPAAIVAVLIFLVIFANEFPDFNADRAAGKKTIVVTLGIKNAANFYRAILIMLCVLAVIYAIANLKALASAVLLIPTISISAICFKNADAEKLSQKGYTALSKSTILLHTIGCIALVAAILLSKPA
ncbi:MAG: 1,4-dihydroxy-2-naphthoate octaprenyltransferase [Phycisphaerae bacterium]|nr:1,4-dihydroxy-2-naphthoate octaprenyltransferase [Phycisphaerae bacterium]